MIHCRLNLLIHGLLHLSLGMSAVAVEYHDQDQNGDEADNHHLTEAVAVVTDVEHTCLIVILQVWVLKNWLANVWRVLETGTDGIHDSLSFHLSTISAVIDND